MATPSSRASMESSPSPSPNSGLLASMSAGVMSSRSSEVMMSCFSSSISVFMACELLFEEIFQAAGQAAGRDAVRHARAVAEGFQLLGRVELHEEAPGLLRHLPPGAALGERRRRAMDQHRHDPAAAAHRHLGRTAAEARRLAGGGAGAFREQHQGAATLQGSHAGIYELGGIGVADVTGGLHETPV